MLQLRRLLALSFARRMIVDTSRRQQGWLALTRGCARWRVLRAGMQHRRIARGGDSWRRLLPRGGFSSLLFVLARTLTLALLLVGGSGVGVSGTTASLAPLARAGGSPPPLLLALSSGMASSPHQTQATLPLSLRSPVFRYVRGYSVQGGSWLCYGWPAETALHCTQHWRVSGGRYVSLNPTFVPSEAAGLTSQVNLSAVRTSSRPANSYPYGQCTWAAAHLANDNLTGLGNAGDWLANAQRRGLPTGNVPRVGATVVYQAGVQGASRLGHVAHVVSIRANGTFVVEEMNYYGYGGGWGKWSYRLSWVQAGVRFIY